MDESTGLILQAMNYAADKHSGQKRKDDKGSPYINHPIEVTKILWEIGGVRDITLLLASILHDTIEDTDATPEEVKAQFGEEVLSLVLEVTDDKTLPKQVRKQRQVETAPHKSPRAKMLKIADKISNVDDIISTPPKDWSLERRREYVLWSERVVAGLRGVNEKLENHYDNLLAKGKHTLRI
jgi:guanosine-3',5'-bis(diphosphate) 3'-pyrophosphohydrolase